MQSIDRPLNRRILVIDDNPLIHDDFRKILVSDDTSADLDDAESAFFGEAIESASNLGVELDSACQGKEGLEKVAASVAENCPYAMAFVDMRMPPGWDGLTTIEKIWEADPDLQVVICTAYSDNTWADIFQRLGYTDQLLILKKPFDNAEVCQIALALTEKWNLTQQARLKQEDLQRLVEQRTAQLREMEASLHQKQKMEALGSLAGGVAHEFNNLLQVIRGYTEFAMESVPTGEQTHQDLLQVLEASKQAAAITEQLLRFGQRRAVEKSMQEVNQVVNSAIGMLRPMVGEQIKIQLDLDDQAGTIEADGDLISQALLNLCINARDAMPSGGQLTISTRLMKVSDRRGRIGTPQQPQLEPGSYLTISITDTGSGIDPDIVERIFDPFFTTRGVGEGSGLGLAMVIGTVEDHQGTVTVESSVGQGTTFRIFLPISRSSIPDAPLPKEDSNLMVSGTDETILLAEDEPMVREIAARVLQKAGYTVVTASDGEDALNKYLEHADSIDLVVLDAVMPKLTGRQVYQQIRQLRPSMKVVFCTGYDPETAHNDEATEAGSIFLTKPYEELDLLQSIRMALDSLLATQELSSV